MLGSSKCLFYSVSVRWCTHFVEMKRHVDVDRVVELKSSQIRFINVVFASSTRNVALASSEVATSAKDAKRVFVMTNRAISAINVRYGRKIRPR